jgi:hypothetical protein
VELVDELVNCCDTVVVKLVAEAGDTSGTQRKRDINSWKHYQATAMKM